MLLPLCFDLTVPEACAGQGAGPTIRRTRGAGAPAHGTVPSPLPSLGRMDLMRILWPLSVHGGGILSFTHVVPIKKQIYSSYKVSILLLTGQPQATGSHKSQRGCSLKSALSSEHWHPTPKYSATRGHPVFTCKRKPPGTCVVETTLGVHTYGKPVGYSHRWSSYRVGHTCGEASEYLYVVTMWMEVLMPVEKALDVHTCNRSVVADTCEGGKASFSTVFTR